MPELPEVESARAAIAKAGLGRVIADVDDSDTYECRPHAPGEIRAALIGRSIDAVHRRGKSMWCDTSGVPTGSGTGDGADDGPALGLHLGMSGHILITEPDGEITDGGDWMGGRYARAAARRGDLERWDRFRLDFADGGSLRLFDPRRLGRVRLDPDLSELGPDAAEVTLKQFRERVGRGTAPMKARLLDQSAIAGIGNLLADQILWQARVSPRRATGSLGDDELAALRRVVRREIRSAIRLGGSHTGAFIRFRQPGTNCPRCGTALVRATIGGRTTWWCPKEQT